MQARGGEVEVSLPIICVHPVGRGSGQNYQGLYHGYSRARDTLTIILDVLKNVCESSGSLANHGALSAPLQQQL